MQPRCYKPAKAKEFYVILGLSTLGGLLINLVGVNPVPTAFWTAVINGFLAPPILVVIMLVSSNRKIMGQRVNGWTSNILAPSHRGDVCGRTIGLVLTWG